MIYIDKKQQLIVFNDSECKLIKELVTMGVKHYLQEAERILMDENYAAEVDGKYVDEFNKKAKQCLSIYFEL